MPLPNRVHTKESMRRAAMAKPGSPEARKDYEEKKMPSMMDSAVRKVKSKFISTDGGKIVRKGGGGSW